MPSAVTRSATPRYSGTSTAVARPWLASAAGRPASTSPSPPDWANGATSLATWSTRTSWTSTCYLYRGWTLADLAACVLLEPQGGGGLVAVAVLGRDHERAGPELAEQVGLVADQLGDVVGEHERAPGRHQRALGDDDDARVGDEREPLAVVAWVVADHAARLDLAVLVEQHAAQPGVAADVAARQDHRVADLGAGVHEAVVRQHDLADRGRRDDRALADQAVVDLGRAVALAGAHEPGRRVVALRAADPPLSVVEVEQRDPGAQLHVRGEVAVDRADVAPVRRGALGLARD